MTLSFELPSEVETNEASAGYEDGVLKRVLPKRQKSPSGRTFAIE